MFAVDRGGCSSGHQKSKHRRDIPSPPSSWNTKVLKYQDAFIVLIRTLPAVWTERSVVLSIKYFSTIPDSSNFLESRCANCQPVPPRPGLQLDPPPTMRRDQIRCWASALRICEPTFSHILERSICNFTYTATFSKGVGQWPGQWPTAGSAFWNAVLWMAREGLQQAFSGAARSSLSKGPISRISIESLSIWVHAIHAYMQGPDLGPCHTCKFDAMCYLRMRNLLPQCHRSQKVNEHLLILFHFFGPNLGVLDPSRILDS